MLFVSVSMWTEPRDTFLKLVSPRHPLPLSLCHCVCGCPTVLAGALLESSLAVLDPHAGAQYTYMYIHTHGMYVCKFVLMHKVERYMYVRIIISYNRIWHQRLLGRCIVANKALLFSPLSLDTTCLDVSFPSSHNCTN